MNDINFERTLPLKAIKQTLGGVAISIFGLLKMGHLVIY